MSQLAADIRLPTSRCRESGERGSTTIQMVILMPALLAVIWFGVQAALVYHAGALASAAAREGARAAGAENSAAAAGIAAATSYITDTAGDSLQDTRITGRRTQTTATIQVSGRALSVFPLVNPEVTKSATVTVERITQ